jgi:hypothetical protein
MIILDTNVLSALMQAPHNTAVVAWIDAQPRSSIWLTTVTIMESRYGITIMSAGRKREARAAEFERILRDDFEDRVLFFDTASAEQAASLLAARRATGRTIELRDTMIAGIAVAHNATIATRNVRHFDDLPVPVIDPWNA